MHFCASAGNIFGKKWKPMLTLFSVPKAFCGEFATIQQNAIRSWTHLTPACEIVLLGDDRGTREMAAEVGARHLPSVERNEYGTPSVRSIFGEAEERAKHDILCYVNADIILLEDFLPAVTEMARQFSRFLLVGQRTNLDVRTTLDFSPRWEGQLRTRLQGEGALEAINGLDYFAFPRGLWGSIPPFALGRTLWDQWFIYRARSRKVPVIDGTQRVTVIHQRHGYGHFAGGKDGVWKGFEAQRNLTLAGGLHHAYTLSDATHKFTARGIESRLLPYDFRRCLLLPITTNRLARPVVRLAKSVLGGSVHRSNEKEVPQKE
jgi:hypothetical protein